MKSVFIAIQMDAFETLDAAIDSTLLLMRAAYRRDYTLFVYRPEALRWESDDGHGRVLASGAMVTGWADDAFLPILGDATEVDLAQCDVVLMRQDPPFDMAYITATYLLELLPPSVLVINNPKAVRDAPEKIFIARYPDLLPPSLIGSDVTAIQAFQARHGQLVLKPLYGFGASGIELLPVGSDVTVIQDFCRRQQGLPFVAQKFLPQVTEGDKRILLLNGEILGAVNRVPQGGNWLANIHVGGKAEAAQVSAQEAAMVARFAPDLVQRGIFLAGIDVIGSYITEINVTCPSALLVANQANGLTGDHRLEEKFWKAAISF